MLHGASAERRISDRSSLALDRSSTLQVGKVTKMAKVAIVCVFPQLSGQRVYMWGC